jgi:hypothetical protein
MKWLFYILFAFGCIASIATRGATDKKQKRVYLLITIAIYILIFILANTILQK